MTTVAVAGPAAGRLADELARRLRGRSITSSRGCRTFEADFGGVARARPAAVVAPAAADDVAAVFSIAGELGLRVSLRGSGHSCDGQTLAGNGIVVLSRSLTEAISLSQEGLVEVSGGHRWGTVERWLNLRGRSVPVLADALGLSVGGTLSVGGYGIDSVARGALVDQVVRLRLVTPDGAVRWCSPGEEGELYRSTLAGLGQLGFIDRAVLRTVPFHPLTSLERYDHASPAELFASLEWMARATPGPAMFKAHLSPTRMATYYGAAGRAPGPLGPPGSRPQRSWTIPAYRHLRNAGVYLWLAAFRRHRRPWCDYFVDREGLGQLAPLLGEMLAEDAVRRVLPTVFALAVRRPRGALRLPFEGAGATAGTAFGIGLYFMVRDGDDAGLALVERTSRRLLDVCLRVGGRPYLYGRHRLTGEESRRLWGEDLDRLAALRRRFDPASVLVPAAPLAAGR